MVGPHININIARILTVVLTNDIDDNDNDDDDDDDDVLGAEDVGQEAGGSCR